MSGESTPARTLWAGCGRLGLRAGAALVAAGGEVHALRRDVSGLPEGFGAVPADLAHPVEGMLPPADAMVITLPPPETPGGYETVLRHLAAALPQLPARTVFVSSTRVFEGYAARADPAPVLTEEDAPQPLGDRARNLLDGERAARELFDAIVVRPAGIYGPGRDRLLRTVRAGRPVAHRRRTNRIHEEDLARLLVALLEHPDPPQLLHAVDDAPARLGEVVTHIADRLALPVPPAAEPDPGHGTVLSGALRKQLLGPLRHPDFRSGYDAMLVDQRH
ncbi:NAD(P)-dependent oxidoreductase [Brachybacterium vulturis]|uniref:NAD(P)-dependent oxidoreductase n=1 Tax=Brachybacterium vulturis TaxID=2017484 RepID=A0A291GKY3_9MICO|nr:sugar nucleotide-binding protein [Brachybacterium vulturis]ATG50867.1 NAD(P)-dependent oxidoreductase [Brachybacterium vulturis]